MHVPALIQKHEQSPRIGFLLSLWQLRSLFCRLLNAPLSDRDKKNKKRVCYGLLFPGNLDLSSLTSGGPVVLLF